MVGMFNWRNYILGEISLLHYRLGNYLAISHSRLGAYLALSHGVAVTGSCPLGLQKPSILQSPLSIWLDAQPLSWLLPVDCALSHLRSHGLSLSLCHWLVFWGLQAQFHQRPLTYLLTSNAHQNENKLTMFC